jgi:hypothetical protein
VANKLFDTLARKLQLVVATQVLKRTKHRSSKKVKVTMKQELSSD